MGKDEEKGIKTLGELRVLPQKLPRLDKELDAFAADIEDMKKDKPFGATALSLGFSVAINFGHWV